MPSLSEKFHDLRRKTMPPSVNDITWRHAEMTARLDRVEKSVSRALDLVAASQPDILATLRWLRPMAPTGKRKIRVGDPGDGGYVCLDDFEGLACGLSFGVNDNDTWDLEIAERGVRVLQFDHTIERAPSTHPLLEFHKTMIAAAPGEGCATLPDLVRANGGAGPHDVLLKCDIEGDEWPMLDACPPDVLARCAQIVCEFHDLQFLALDPFRQRAHRVFEKLNRAFFVAHVHGNNCTPMVNIANVPVPSTIEVTFVNRARCACEESGEVFPTALDAPNNAAWPDLFLGAFRF